MKKISYFKEAMLQVTIVAAMLLTVSCNNSQTPRDTKEIAEDHNDAEFTNNKQERDAQFLVNAAEINLEQIQLGKLAQQIGRTTHVKDLGKMMEDAHTKSQKDLTALANSKMITIPTSATDNAKDAYNRLNEKSGDDFDKTYADMMVNSHKDAIDAFENASTDSYNAEIKNWATLSLPDLRKNLDLSIECQKKCDTVNTK